MTESKFNRIGIKAIDRGGSNLMLALLHYHDNFFSLSEKATFDTTKPEDYPAIADPYWQDAVIPASQRGDRPTERNDMKFVKWLHLQNSSIFHVADNHKKFYKVNNIVQKIPRDTINPNVDNYASFEYKYYDYEYDKIFCVLRNPFRVTISSYFRWFVKPASPEGSFCRRCRIDIASEIQNDLLISVVNWTSDRISEIKNRQVDKFVNLEYFITNFETELPKLITWADNTATPINSRNIGSIYFQNTGHVGRTFAGSFNPSNEITIERINNRNIEELFSLLSDETIQYCKQKLGDELFNYWRHESSHNYEVDLNLA
tara:strand:- start:676 stop:1623 length:948 start_codon:yes stop_codon:yes gene_type:complete